MITRLARAFSRAVQLSQEDSGLRTITLQRHEAKNALGRVFLEELAECVQTVQNDAGARAVLLRSAVKNVFCAGADLKERAEMSADEVAAFVLKLRSTFTALEDLPVPTIAVIEGFALGGGLEMALACDMRVASPEATIGLVETGLAIIPGAGGTYRLPRLIGLPRAKEMILTATRYTAAQCLQYGVLNQVADNATEAAQALAAKICQNGPVAVRMAKRAIDTSFGKDRVSGLSIEGLCYAQVIPTVDRLEALQAFKEKRKPKFIGK